MGAFHPRGRGPEYPLSCMRCEFPKQVGEMCPGSFGAGAMEERHPDTLSWSCIQVSDTVGAKTASVQKLGIEQRERRSRRGDTFQ